MDLRFVHSHDLICADLNPDRWRAIEISPRSHSHERSVGRRDGDGGRRERRHAARRGAAQRGITDLP